MRELDKRLGKDFCVQTLSGDCVGSVAASSTLSLRYTKMRSRRVVLENGVRTLRWMIQNWGEK